MAVLSDYMAKVKLKSEKLTSIASQTVFTLSTVTIRNSDPDCAFIVINGKKQPQDAYTVDSTTQITLSEGLEVGDVVEVTVTGY